MLIAQAKANAGGPAHSNNIGVAYMKPAAVREEGAEIV